MRVNKPPYHHFTARLLAFSVGILLSYNSFSKDPEEKDFLIKPKNAYEIGDTGPAGGWVFYVAADGLHGLEAAPTDQDPGISWSNGEAYTQADGDGLGAGNMNTMLIIAVQGGDVYSYAAGLCANLVITNPDTGVPYGDWYLPSKYELSLMWENLADSDGDGHNSGPSDPNNLGGFASDFYWSSTEINLIGAYAHDLDDGNNQVNDEIGRKSDKLRVRAVRAF